MSQLVLSLFPGVGLLDMAFEQEGFCVVQDRDWIMGGDVRKKHFPAGRFDGVIGGPPCQIFSRLARMVKRRGYEPTFGNLIPEFERAVAELKPTWFVMENVPDAPTPTIAEYGTWSTILNNRQCFTESGEPAEQNRIRRWTFGDRRTGKRTALMIETTALENGTFLPTAIGGHSKNGQSASAKLWQRTTFRTAEAFKRICAAQGLPDDFDLPAFTVAAKCKAVGNGVPIPMGRAIAKAVREAVCG